MDGGSAGGYMSLAMTADFFPVVAATADAPVCNWAYNGNYIAANKPASKFPGSTMKESPLPILYVVSGLADLFTDMFGPDLSADAYYYISPISYLDRITCPVFIQCSTGDMLVPLEQMTAKIERPLIRRYFQQITCAISMR